MLLFEGSAAAQRTACLPQTGVKGIKLRAGLACPINPGGMQDAKGTQRDNGATPTRLTLKGGSGALGYPFYARCSAIYVV